MGRLFQILAGFALPLLFLIGGASRAEASCGQQQGGNFVINETFNSSISGWALQAGSAGTATWDSMDADANKASGSLSLINNGGGPGQTVSVSQCLPISGGASYSLSDAINHDNACCVAGEGDF